MLVLTRKVGEEIIIGGNIRVKIISVKGDRIRLGIEAPNDVQVNRAEIHEHKMVSLGVCEETVDLGASHPRSGAETSKF